MTSKAFKSCPKCLTDETSFILVDLVMKSMGTFPGKGEFSFVPPKSVAGNFGRSALVVCPFELSHTVLLFAAYFRSQLFGILVSGSEVELVQVWCPSCGSQAPKQFAYGPCTEPMQYH